MHVYRFDVSRHVSLVRVGRLLIGNAAGKSEVRDPVHETLKLLDKNQVRIIRHAVDQMGRILTPRMRDGLQHCKKRSEPGPSRKEQERPPNFSQIETSQRPHKFHLHANLCALAHEARQQSAWSVADQKGYLGCMWG